MSKIIDVTIPLSAQVPVYPGDTRFVLETTDRIETGGSSNMSRITMSSHAGTHVDAPYHFLADGATVDQLPLEILMGKARVVQVAAVSSIERSNLESLGLHDDIRLLIKTRNSGMLRQPDFQSDFVSLSPAGAAYLAQAGIKLVGLDYLSIDPCPSADHPAHHALLEAGVVVVEGLDLSRVEPGEYDMVCLPLRIEGGDGSPARVVLRPRL
jgi:arylformamidase